jgi:hypothetical protein
MAAKTLATAFEGHWALPPLILHPFSGEDATEKLLEGSKASLMLHGLIPNAGKDREWLNEAVLRARLQEIRMLYFLGKDLTRWVDQCVDFVDRTPQLRHKGIRGQSFAAFLVENPPDSISGKLQTWGVTDQRSVFTRALGITSALEDAPTADTFTPLFLTRYHRFLDYFYVCYQNLEAFTELSPVNFGVEMYASAEYSQMLEDQWAKEI